MRHIDRAFLIEMTQAKGRSSGTRSCEVPKCTLTTREGKPYCPDHVDHNPYVQDILQHIAVQDDEQETAKREAERLKMTPKAKVRDVVDLDGPTAKAIIQQLDQHGTRTMERLARETNVDEDVLRIFIRALVKANIVQLGQTNRGSDTVRLTKAKDSTPKPKSKPRKKKTKADSKPQSPVNDERPT